MQFPMQSCVLANTVASTITSTSDHWIMAGCVIHGATDFLEIAVNHPSQEHSVAGQSQWEIARKMLKPADGKAVASTHAAPVRSAPKIVSRAASSIMPGASDGITVQQIQDIEIEAQRKGDAMKHAHRRVSAGET